MWYAYGVGPVLDQRRRPVVVLERRGVANLKPDDPHKQAQPRRLDRFLPILNLRRFQQDSGIGDRPAHDNGAGRQAVGRQQPDVEVSERRTNTIEIGPRPIGAGL